MGKSGSPENILKISLPFKSSLGLSQPLTSRWFLPHFHSGCRSNVQFSICCPRLRRAPDCRAWICIWKVRHVHPEFIQTCRNSFIVCPSKGGKIHPASHSSGWVNSKISLWLALPGKWNKWILSTLGLTWQIENIPWKVSIGIFSLYFTSRDSRDKFPAQDWRLNPLRFCAKVHQLGDVFWKSWILVFMENMALEQLLETQRLHVGKKWVSEMARWEMEVKNLSGCLRIPRCSCIYLCWVLRASSQGFPFGFFQFFPCTLKCPRCWRSHPKDFHLYWILKASS